MSRRYDCAEPDQRAIGLREAAATVRRGDLIVLPTDTVYGIGADAFSSSGIAALLAAKGRGRDMPVPVLVGSPSTLHGLVSKFPENGWDLVDAFWPGALTIVARHQPSLQWDLGDARGTVALRMPLHPVAIELLTQTGPLGVSSANKAGRAAAVTASEAQDQFGTAVDVYLDGGQTVDNTPSSIVDLTGETPKLLREGGLTFEEIAKVATNLTR
ncbi:threonylcarbamoyl-AMP synthase [Actinospica sp. MGRD01-02]|uniref:L-threonylcarbamoyladenylate synthase n=1 Tax=Actinospica acidithermotolerans TaxID=2828514 RepID=A0A941E5U3_9ACTN|nr:L-threonylcarbamoyladenylate synthase [Actinospica acidithermotolerans]MBR7824972.1 threonylcarbamoyl-AMP synthase [Actinospica acidithermotolerans]